MSKTSEDVFRSLAWPTYFLAFLMISTPAADYVTNVWPLRIGDVGWRYGSVGLFAGFLLTPLFGIMFAIGASVVLEHRVVLRTLSVLNIVFAAILIVLIVFFALDAVQVRATIPADATAEARSMFHTGTAKAAFKFFVYAIGLGWLGIAGVRAGRSMRNMGRKQQKTSDATLVRAARDEGSEVPGT